MSGDRDTNPDAHAKAPAERPGIAIRHTGRKTLASIVADERRLEAFRLGLLREEFVIDSSADDTVELSRKIRLMRGDWPMRVAVRKDGDRLLVTWYMFIPWAWIVAFALFVFLFLPFMTFQGAPLAFVLAIAVLVMAVYKQKFDLSPNASWQGPPRKQWNETMRRLLQETLASDHRQ